MDTKGIVRMNRFKIVIFSILIGATGSLAMAPGVVAQEPGLPGTLIPGNRLFATGNEIWLQFRRWVCRLRRRRLEDDVAA